MRLLDFIGNKEHHQPTSSSHFSSLCFTHLSNTESTDVSARGVSIPNQFLLLIGAGGMISSLCSPSLNLMSFRISHIPRFKIWCPSLKTTVPKITPTRDLHDLRILIQVLRLQRLRVRFQLCP